jgi:hypothetical protein
MKLSSFVAVAATAALTLLDGASAAGHYTPITGAVNAGVVERLPVQTLAKNKDVFSIFLWALVSFKHSDACVRLADGLNLAPNSRRQ